MRKDAYSGHLDMLLLAAVRARPMHGYAVIEHVREASGGAFDYAEGTIYPALRRLEDEGLVESTWSDQAGRRRRIYRLTKRGERELAGEQERWQRYTTSVQAILNDG